MEIRQVGGSGLEVSRLGLGTMTWGRDTDADEAAAQLEAFVGAGGTLIDTANIYGDGDAESILGTLVPDVVPRDKVVLATTTVGVGGGRGRLLAALDASLRRLGTDHVDLWQVHGWDAAVPFEETWPRWRSAVTSGRARYVGVSGFDRLAARHRWPPSCEHLGSPLASLRDGVLAAGTRRRGVGAARGGGARARRARLGAARPRRAHRQVPARHAGGLPRRLAALRPLRRPAPHRSRRPDRGGRGHRGRGARHLAAGGRLAWVRDRPGVASAVVGARDAAQLRGTLAAEELDAAGRDLAALDDVSGPDPRRRRG